MNDAPLLNQTPNVESADKTRLNLQLTFSMQCGDPKSIIEFLSKLQSISFPNGSVTKRYEETIVDFQDLLKSQYNMKIAPPEAKGFDELGLECIYENGALKFRGKPSCACDCDVVIKIARCECPEFPLGAAKGAKFRAQLKLFEDQEVARPRLLVHPDPYSLWVELEPKESEPYRKDHAAREGRALAVDPSFAVLAASKRGRTHAHDGKFRDDHFVVKLGSDANAWNFVAVADGAGSARFSREGSRLACETCVQTLDEILNAPSYGPPLDAALKEALANSAHNETSDVQNSELVFDEQKTLESSKLKDYLYNAVYNAYKAIFDEAQKANESLPELAPVKLSDYNTTLLCLAFKKLTLDDAGRTKWIVASYWVGDGGLAVYRPNGRAEVVALGEPDMGEFAGQTRFLTSPDETKVENFVRRIRLKSFDDFQALVLMSDGLTDPFFPAEIDLSKTARWQNFWDETLPSEFPGALDASKSAEERADALLEGLNFHSKGNHDDRTIALVVNDAFKETESFESSSDVPSQEPAKNEVEEKPIEGTDVASQEPAENDAEEKQIEGADAASQESAENVVLPSPPPVIELNTPIEGADAASQESAENDVLPSPPPVIELNTPLEGTVNLEGTSEQESNAANANPNEASSAFN